MSAKSNRFTATVCAAALLILCGQSGFPSHAAAKAPAATEDAQCRIDIPRVIAQGAVAARATAIDTGLQSKLDAAVRSALPETAAPGVIVGVVTPQGTWKSAYGIADPAKGIPMAVGMHTRIGSVTKTFTGTLLMQLAEAGKLSLDDTIAKYVPRIPNGDRITLRQLANMTSGIASYTQSTGFTDLYFAKPQSIWRPKELVAVGVAKSPLFEPGASFNYSNTNTILLGIVIEQVTKKPIAQVLKEQTLDPLKLHNTIWPGDSTDMPTPFAQGFTLQGDFAKPNAPSNATHWNPAWGWTAGELISNLDDLLVYARALGTGHGLLGTAAQAERLTFPAGGGYGIAIGCATGWVGHSGELPGYNTTVFYHTGADTAVVVQTNSDIPSGDCGDQPTLTSNKKNAVCSSPARRVFAAVANALGHPYHGP